MFGKYDKKTFNEIKSQHNIMVLVGNGFDIALLNKLYFPIFSFLLL